MKQITDSFKHALEGIINTIAIERNLKIQIFAMICVITAGLIVKLSQFEWIVCIVMFGLVISAEMFNTSLEKTLDYINTEYDEKIKFIKDASAGAVLVLAITSAVIGIMIFIPKIISSCWRFSMPWIFPQSMRHKQNNFHRQDQEYLKDIRGWIPLLCMFQHSDSRF